MLTSRWASLIPFAGFSRRWSHSVALPTAVLRHLDSLLTKHAALTAELEKGVNEMGASAYTAKAKELASLEHLAALANSWKQSEKQITECEAMLKECDPATVDGKEMTSLLNDDILASEEALLETKEALVDALLPKDEADDRNVILELRAGTGGDEASLFTGEMLEMYERFAALQGWRFQTLSVSKTGLISEAVAVREATASVSGPSVYAKLKFESGVHRVQRIPLTEGGGRVHTSTMSVVVLPEPEEIDVELKASDLVIDTHRASGAGGQHVNTTDSAVRITHIPTGIVVAIQEERSQHSNKARGMQLLRARVYDFQRQAAEKKRSEERKSQMGTAERSERIRTYNFPQNRITDHRSGLSKFGMEQMFAGELLEEFTVAMQRSDRERRLAQLEAEVKVSHPAKSNHREALV